MDKDYLKGIKFGLGVFTIIGVLLGVVFAVGFHTADEILGGTFLGNYTYTGNVNFTGNTYGAGKIVQVVTKEVTDATFSHSSNTWVNVTGLSLNITLSKPTNKVQVIIDSWWGGSSTAGHYALFKVKRDSTDILKGVDAGTRQGVSGALNQRYTTWPYEISINGIDTPGSAGLHTYNLQVYEEAGATIYLNKDGNDADLPYKPRFVSRITLIEIEE